MLYYNGVYYGDWSVFTEEIFKKGEFATIPFEQSKANLPALEQKHWNGKLKPFGLTIVPIGRR